MIPDRDPAGGAACRMLARFGSGAELLDNGRRCRGYNLKDMIFTMVFGPFEYDVRFDADAEGFQEEDLKTMIIKEVSAPVLGNATDLGAN